MFALRSSISLQVSKKIFGIINKRGQGPNKHCWGWKNKVNVIDIAGISWISLNSVGMV